MLWFSRAARKRHGILLSQPVGDSPQCHSCGGACCRSFTSVALTWDEFERLQALGAHGLHLALYGPPLLLIDAGCEFLIDGRCRIYSDRPDVCRRFICQTPGAPPLESLEQTIPH
jgi:Fe-S-cluster containining protein